MAFWCGRFLSQWMVLLLPVIFNVLSIVTSEATYFPSGVKMCSVKDPNLNKCFTDTANQMLKHLIKGSRKLNAVSMDPLHVPLLSLERNSSLLPTLAFNCTDSSHEGWENAVVLHSEINPKDPEFNMTIMIPRYHIRGMYEITGSIVGIPLEGVGDVEMTFYNMSNNVMMRGHLTPYRRVSSERRTEKFLAIDHFTQKTHIDKMTVHFDNLFNNTELSDATNKLLNLNNRAVLDAGAEVVNELWGAIHEGLMRRIFDRVPYEVMFPDLD